MTIEDRRAVSGPPDRRDADTLAEVLWAALHGLVTLDRSGRLRPSHQADRVDLLVTGFSGGTPAQ